MHQFLLRVRAKVKKRKGNKSKKNSKHPCGREHQKQCIQDLRDLPPVRENPLIAAPELQVQTIEHVGSGSATAHAGAG